ncbi:hypothetical protein J8J40_34115, partial [Mycobacterium tuberculosis]|nr:hypothetical protein [Mycobacterium tuberculosis]
RTLFERGAAGYRLAVDGEWLFDRVQGMELAAANIGEWRQELGALPIVSVGADTWTLHELVRNLPDLWSPDGPFRICLK